MRRVRTEVIIETSETIVFKERRHFVRAWCAECGREVSLIPPSEAALLTFRETSQIFSLMDENLLHFRSFHDEKPFICLNSLCAI